MKSAWGVAIVTLAVLQARLVSSQVQSKVDHLVVLLVENRGFDHIFGCAGDELPGIDGIEEGMGNWIDPSNHSKGRLNVTCGSAKYVCEHGPSQSFIQQWKDFYGGQGVPNASGPYAPPTMSGFAMANNEEVLSAFAPEQLPIKMTLAKEFAVFNRFYAAVPGPSQPNHMFAQSGTSCGVTETGVTYWKCGGLLPLFPQRTIYDSLSKAGKSFAIYYNDTPGDIYITSVLEKALLHAHKYNAKGRGFYDAAAQGTLPELSWIVPRYGGPHPNDDHPCHDVALGELLLKEVYESLRAGPKWNKTALLVVYDDPGGFFDHHGPPVSAPPPDAECNKHNQGCPDKFNFDRLGMRLAALLVSPLVPKGTVINDPVGPAPDSKYELTSIASTVKNLFGLPSFLTKRDAWAGDFSKELSLSEPRTDTPLKLPDAPAPADVSFHDVDDDDDDEGGYDFDRDHDGDGDADIDDDEDDDEKRRLVGVHYSGCRDPRILTRRQRRQIDLYTTVLGDPKPSEAELDAMTKEQGDKFVYAALDRVLARLREREEGSRWGFEH